MTRPIKFRAWGEREKRMFSWDWVMGKEFPFLPKDGEGTEHGLFVIGSGYIPMQFTGLLDKNGREIYEGDLIRSLSGFLWKCSFANGRFFLLSVGKDLFPDNSFDDKGYNTYLEVIGNVWENPELLEVQP